MKRFGSIVPRVLEVALGVLIAGASAPLLSVVAIVLLPLMFIPLAFVLPLIWTAVLASWAYRKDRPCIARGLWAQTLASVVSTLVAVASRW
jgi:hypothetical protein